MSELFIDRVRLDRFLAKPMPDHITALCDRLLVASVADDEAVKAAARDLGERSLEKLFKLANDDEHVRGNLTSLCVAYACLDDLGVDASALRLPIAVACKAFDVPEREPLRSTTNYWRHRAQLAREFVDDGAAPGAKFFDFAFYSHRVLFSCHYGAERRADPPGWFEAQAHVDDSDGDSVALLLLSAQCVEPAPDMTSSWQRLAKLQQSDGGFSTRAAGPVARHHAACVTWLAAHLHDRRQKR